MPSTLIEVMLTYLHRQKHTRRCVLKTVLHRLRWRKLAGRSRAESIDGRKKRCTYQPQVSRSGREDEERLISGLIDDEFTILVSSKYL